MKISTIITCFYLILTTEASAQYVADLRRSADVFFEKRNYYSAALYYEQYLNVGETKVSTANYKPYLSQQPQTKKDDKKLQTYGQVAYRLAESYRLYNDYLNAEKWYGAALDFETLYPLTRLWYGISLRANRKYAEAEEQLTQFLEKYTRKDEFESLARKELANCRFIRTQLLAPAATLKVERLTGFVNEGGANYAPVMLDNGQLLFTSSRPDSARSANSKAPYLNAMYLLPSLDNIKPYKLQGRLESSLHQGAASLSKDGNTLYFTRWNESEGKKNGVIYSSRRTAENNWEEAVQLGNNINVQGSSSKQPFLVDDRYLLFASDRAGGAGGFDLWYALLDDGGNPGPAVNLGTVINTPDDEEAPWYHTVSKMLVFASNGRVGMGGFDLFTTTGNFNNWAEPRNMGHPVNSVKDDVYFTAAQSRSPYTSAYFSSDRNSVCCLELFSLAKTSRYASGKVLDCATGTPLTDARVSVVDTVKHNIVHQQAIDATGMYTFSVEAGETLQVLVEKEGYLSNMQLISVNTHPVTDTLFAPALCLKEKEKPFPVGKAVVLKDIYYDFNKASLRPESYPVLDKMITVLNDFPNMQIELSAHTDSKGTGVYNTKLSEARARSCVDYLMSKGVSQERLIFKGYGECCPVAPNEKNGKDNADGRALNRRTEVKVLHY